MLWWSVNSFLFKSVFSYEIGNINFVCFLFANFASTNLPTKFSAVHFLSSWVLIYLSWSQSVVTLFSISLILLFESAFLTKLLTLVILFSTAVGAVVLAKTVILDISFLTSFILALRAVAVAKLVRLGILFLTSFILS